MLGKRIHSFTTAILLAGSALAIGGLLCPSSARAQSSSTESVADAARKAREAKNAAPSGKKVYTDDDVKPAVAAPNPAPAGQPGSDATPATGAAQTTPNGDPNAQPADGTGDKKDDKKDGKADEKAWRARFKAQRDQLARLEQELDVLQREQNKAQVQYYPDPQKALSEGYTRKDINDKDVKIAAKKDEIAKQQQSITDLEDELRASGGDPGWAR
jgi:hypothetical protein